MSDLEKWEEDMNELLASVAEESDDPLVLAGRKLGAATLLTLLEEVGGPLGMTVYMPSAESFFNRLAIRAQENEIRKRYDGTNATQLCIEYQMKPSKMQKVLARS